MKENTTSRRNILKSSFLFGAGLTTGVTELMAAPAKKAKHNFTYSLNTATIREQKLGLVGEIETAAKAGYDGIEVWVSTVEEYVKKGGSLKDIKKLASDLGIVIEDGMGFSKWIVDDPAERALAMEQNKREMGMLAEIGCKRIAAPPMGATNQPGLDLMKAAERYAALLKLGTEMGVKPQLEVWGFSANLHRFGEALYVASESGEPNAIILPDVYHIYKGGSDFNSLKMINGKCIEMFHMNDYPADPPKATINDSHRVFPGDGVAPLNQILKDLNDKNSPIVLSLELFNKEYWKMPAYDAAKIGLDKMKASVAKAMAAS
ncbi:TIM barrel protein [Emticicia sp. CRIBPO]|uniref:sugar phosphate isomerase/epimerase family protein n=1 Tax=Emticicia sp. CRIBPO TaxID=2683258 RepID=UPI001411FD17|nr:sugar phosphate isomerase/epimerase family protein [Emticicia sp. CRIBPO]NBA87994.1 TIM barrel protein [Emticicia sp. CRIBPO]